MPFIRSWVYAVGTDGTVVYHLSGLGEKDGEEWYVLSEIIRSAKHQAEGQLSFHMPAKYLSHFKLFPTLDGALGFASGNKDAQEGERK